MNYEYKIEELCRQLAATRSEDDAARLAREISFLLHWRVEELRANLSNMPLLSATRLSQCAPEVTGVTDKKSDSGR
jgi:hypothetical protein